VSFLRDNFRWLAGGFLLTYFSTFGQTYFIALSSGHIRAEYGLSHGGFGTLFMVATLGSALTMPYLGQMVDRMSAKAVTLVIVPTFALACVLMAVSRNIVLLALSIYLLRLLGPGMMNQNALTAAARWFSAQRGRAMALTAIGGNGSEATVPFLFVTVASLIGWRNGWLVGAAILAFIALPTIAWLLRTDRVPQHSEIVRKAGAARDWTRGEVLRDPLFYFILFGTMVPGFIGTTVSFHQVYLVHLRGWSLELFAAAFTVMAASTVCAALVCGQLVDRFSAVRILPVFLVPVAFGSLALSLFTGEWTAFAFMSLVGMSYGCSGTIMGAVWPEVYGTAHLGAIRAMMASANVLGTAIGPGLTGILIDMGVDLPVQVGAMSAYAFTACISMIFVSRRLTVRLAARD
jgi:MFS family permease